MKMKVKTDKNSNIWRITQKVSLVIFITVLIWVWADLSLDEEHRESSAILTITPSSDPSLWVRFKDDNSLQISLNQITLAGPVLRIAQLRKDLESGDFKLRFTLDPDEEVIKESQQPYSIAILNILQKSSELRKRGLKITDCSPEKVDVLATKLVMRTLKVVCYDGDAPITNAQVEPETIQMLVPPTIAESELAANIRLKSQDIARAKEQAIEMFPSIDFAVGITRQSDKAVKVKLPETDIKLETFSLQGRIGFIVNSDVLEKYKIDLLNAQEFASTVQIRATKEAFEAYRNQIFHYLLELKTEDAKAEITTRTPQYNFPESFIQKGQIQKIRELESARFKLIPISAPVSESINQQ